VDSLFDSDSLGLNVSNEAISCVSNTGLGGSSIGVQAILKGDTSSDEVSLEFGTASFKSSFGTILSLGHGGLGCGGSVIDFVKKTSLGSWKVLKEVSIEEVLDLIVSGEVVWIISVWLVVVN